MAGFGQETRQHQAEPEAEERLGVPPQYYMERREHDHSLQFHASNISSMMKRVLENTCRMFCFHEATVQMFERLSCCRCSRCGRSLMRCCAPPIGCMFCLTSFGSCLMCLSLEMSSCRCRKWSESSYTVRCALCRAPLGCRHSAAAPVLREPEA
eukprot:m.736021 g.736021  ORF g.736021 m.736021 type:complete len:154 (-) comp58893_c0_seq46:110-571(-)